MRTHLAPGERVGAARRAVVDECACRFHHGRVPGDTDHQIDGNVNGDEVSHGIVVTFHCPQNSLASLQQNIVILITGQINWNAPVEAKIMSSV